jgi:hypothetical protein
MISEVRGRGTAALPIQREPQLVRSRHNPGADYSFTSLIWITG